MVDSGNLALIRPCGATAPLLALRATSPVSGESVPEGEGKERQSGSWPPLFYSVKIPQYPAFPIVISSTKCYTNSIYPQHKICPREVTHRARRTQSLPPPCPDGCARPAGRASGPAPRRASAAEEKETSRRQTPPQPPCAGAVFALPAGRGHCVGGAGALLGRGERPRRGGLRHARRGLAEERSGLLLHHTRPGHARRGAQGHGRIQVPGRDRLGKGQGCRHRLCHHPLRLRRRVGRPGGKLGAG